MQHALRFASCQLKACKIQAHCQAFVHVGSMCDDYVNRECMASTHHSLVQCNKESAALAAATSPGMVELICGRRCSPNKFPCTIPDLWDLQLDVQPCLHGHNRQALSNWTKALHMSSI